MMQKYEYDPKKDEANWLLFSMHDIAGINNFLLSFPMQEKQKGCSATLVWSGVSGFNVRVEPFKDRKIGFVLDPEKIIVPQADLFAQSSESLIKPELLKINARNKDFLDGTEGKYISKYPNKAGYYRPLTIFVTNLARNEHIAGKKESVYHSEGRAEIFAKNIWRKYHKPNTRHSYFREASILPYVSNGIMDLNEAIVFQKGPHNPIAGLLITETPNWSAALQLLHIMQNNPLLKLYFYDISSTEHIIRYLGNTQAQTYLRYRMDFKSVFEKAQPFKGFSPAPLEQGQEQELEFGVMDVLNALGSNALSYSIALLDALTSSPIHGTSPSLGRF